MTDSLRNQGPVPVPDPLEKLFNKRDPTDKELTATLPALSLEQRIEAVIRKYVGGAMSNYDGERTASEADQRIATYLMRKIKPWLKDHERPATDAQTDLQTRDQALHQLVAMWREQAPEDWSRKHVLEKCADELAAVLPEPQEP